MAISKHFVVRNVGSIANDSVTFIRESLYDFSLSMMNEYKITFSCSLRGRPSSIAVISRVLSNKKAAIIICGLSHLVD
jgi:hypothetical protein